MKIEGNKKCHACPRVLASVVFRYPVFSRYTGIPPLFLGVTAILLVFSVLLFPVPVLRHCSVLRMFCVLSFRVPVFLVLQYAYQTTTNSAVNRNLACVINYCINFLY